MRYAKARLNKEKAHELFEEYVSQGLMIISQTEAGYSKAYLAKSFNESKYQKPAVENGEAIAADIMIRAGLHFKAEK